MSTNNSKSLPMKLVEVEGSASRLDVCLRSDLQFAVMLEHTEQQELVSIILNAPEMNEMVDRIGRAL